MKASLEIDGVIVDCWSALILVSQGCCLRELASCSLSNLCLSQDWSKPGNLYTFLYFFPTLTLYSSQSLLFYLLSVILLWSHPIGHVSVLFPSLPSDSQTPCREQWTGKEQQEREGGVQPAEVKGESAAGQGVGVCVYVGVGGGKHRLCLSSLTPPPAHKPDRHLDNRTIISAAADTAGLKGDF